MAELDNLTDKQLDALIAQSKRLPLHLQRLLCLRNKTLSEMKGLTKAGGIGLIKGATECCRAAW